jgi:flagellar basal body-associated protein FliL
VPHRLVLICCALAAAGFVGCGKSRNSATDLEASELLALLQDRQQTESRSLVETDLGRFRVTHQLADGDGQLHVQFHLFGVLAEERQQRFSQVWPHREKRVRDAIISLCQRTETEHLADPNLTLFKEEIVATVNRMIQERLIIDVAFSDFSTDREAGMPWSMPATAKPSSGGHGH